MAYFIRYKGDEVRCETADEVRALLDGQSPKAIPPTKSSRHKRQTDPHTAHLSGTNKLAKFVSRLSDQQRALLRAIANKGTISADELRSELDLPSGKHVAGQMSGITKAAKSLGLSSPVHTIAKRSRIHGRTYAYELQGEAKQQLRELVAK